MYRGALTKFADAVPGISIDYTPGSGSTHFPKIKAEQEGGQFLYDVMVGGAGSGWRNFIPAGLYQPLKPHIVRSDVLDDSKWVNGFEFGWQDTPKTHIYGFEATVTRAVWVDREKIPESELSTLEQLVDPKYDGKIVMHDPRISGSGAGAIGHRDSQGVAHQPRAQGAGTPGLVISTARPHA